MRRFSVPVYRLFFLDPDNGRIQGFEDVASADDVGAICLVNERPLPGPAELWLGSRKVIHLEAAPVPTPARGLMPWGAAPATVRG